MGDVKTVSIVDVKPASLSKINSTQVASSLAVPLAAWLGIKFQLPEEVQAALIVVISWAFNVTTIILKTYFTSTITPQSANNAELVMKDSQLSVTSN